MFKSLISAIVDRAKERGTWRGIVASISGVLGITLGAEYVDAVATVGVALFGVVEIVFREHGYITHSSANDTLI